MSKKITVDELKRCLANYQKVIAIDADSKRTALWVLYDYYKKVLRLAGLDFFEEALLPNRIKK